ncbi:MAG: BREX-1 system phosphatase PglZ type A, partial [Deltaproteobacteria bacterium]|nr:BREX-1 system phosphatase PglZ type A [Deltaproteobacteria bacterium]
IDAVLENLLAELASGKDEKSRLIERCGLQPYLWKRVERHYGYQSENPGLKDFLIEMFKTCYEWNVGITDIAQGERQVFLNRWKDNVRHGEAYEKLAHEYAEILQVDLDLQQRDLKILGELDYFSQIDRRILMLLIEGINSRTMPLDDCVEIVRRRRASHWYREFADIYEAVYHAALFLQHVHGLDVDVETATAAIRKYTGHWFKIDQLYRKFIYHRLQSGQTTLLQDLNRLVENHYTNTFLLAVNDNWQKIVDGLDRWRVDEITPQQDFFRDQIKPYLVRKNKVVVIVSDALRYEIGDEFVSLIRHEDRYTAKLKPMLAMLPSYTQLGMAALLPHHKLSFAADGAGAILVGGMSSMGTENRAKILQQQVAAGGTALQADALLGMNRDECRQLIRENQVIYVYHNRIDATGDKKESEGRVFAAVEEALQELL